MRNHYVICGDNVEVTLHRRKKPSLIAIVSKSKLAKLRDVDVTWYAAEESGQQTLVVQAEIRKGDRKEYMRLSRFLTDCPRDSFVVHLDGDTLNNTDSNLSVSRFNSQGKYRVSVPGPQGVRFDEDKQAWYVVAKFEKRHSRLFGEYATHAEAETVLKQFVEYWKPYTYS